MSSNNETTTLVCLFHHFDQASAALNDLRKAEIPSSSITVIGGDDAEDNASSAAGLTDLGIPSRDLQHLRDGLENGGTIVAVSTITDHVSTVEGIFGKHRASKIDEAVADDTAESLAGPSSIPVVEEELTVGKRTVDQGGVRVFRRTVEIPAEASVTLRDEHVSINRTPVDRPATEADLAMQGTQTLELTETAEEAVVGKSARVVEEVLVGKRTGERTEHIQDTVRRTEVEVEDLPPTAHDPANRRV